MSLSVSPSAPCEGPRPLPLVKWRVMVRSPGASDAADAAWTPLLPEGVLEAGQDAVIVGQSVRAAENPRNSWHRD